MFRSCMQALNLGWGPSFVELRWTERGPVVIEVNPRLAGGVNPRLVQRSYGIDLVTEHVKLVIGEQWDLRRTHSQVAGVRFLVADRNGTLDRIGGNLHAAAVPGIVEVDLYVEPSPTMPDLPGRWMRAANAGARKVLRGPAMLASVMA